jgi:hypothetical protein
VFIPLVFVLPMFMEFVVNRVGVENIRHKSNLV